METTASCSQDIAALRAAYQLKSFAYKEILQQETNARLLARWPLLAQVLALSPDHRRLDQSTCR